MAEGDAELADLYRDVLLDYFRSGRRKGTLESPDIRGHGVNPLCGDEVELTLSLDEDRIREVRYAGHGCVISQASSAMLAEALEGLTLARAGELAEAFRAMLLKDAPAESLPEDLEQAKALAGVRKFPVRVKCALLAWNTLQLGLRDGRSTGAEFTETEAA